MPSRAVDIVAYCDGSCHTESGKLGIGIVFKGHHGRTVWTVTRRAGWGSSFIAEYKAVICAMKMLSAMDVPRIRIFTDNHSVAMQLVGALDPPRTEQMLECYNEAKSLVSSFAYCDIVHITREYNSEADKLAKRAIGAH